MGGVTPPARPTVGELRAFFTACSLPTAPVPLCPGSTITDARRFVSGHLAALSDEGKPRKVRALFYHRLTSLFHYLHAQ